MTILIAEDELIPAHYLKKLLTENAYDVLDIVTKGADVIEVAKTKKPNVILMDVMLKDNISGCDAAVQISHINPEILIVFLTAYSDKEMIDFAVNSKAFAYLLKPYRDKEILATLELAKAQLNQPVATIKTPPQNNSMIALVENYYFNTESQTLFYGKKEMSCGPKALELIALLCEHKGSTVKIVTLLETLWEEGASQQTLCSLIHRIRENTSQNLIINVNKLGYKIGLKD